LTKEQLEQAPLLWKFNNGSSFTKGALAFLKPCEQFLTKIELVPGFGSWPRGAQ